MNEPLVTVVVPVFNGEKYVRNCLDILMSQSYTNIEVIVVNDGSTDNSVSIIKGFPVKLIEHSCNKGLSEARNTGISNASGDYIHFLDNDDLINRDFYKNLVEASEAYQADISACGIIHQKAQGKTQIYNKLKVHNSLSERLLATYVGKNGYCVRYLFKTSFLKEKNLQFEKGRYIEDLPFSFAAVYHANKLVTVPDATYTYVFTLNSIMNTKNPEIRKKRSMDKKYSKDFVITFAKENGNFKIPGVTSGKLQYIFKKLLMKIRMSL